jgi:hypothetical protein
VESTDNERRDDAGADGETGGDAGGGASDRR